MEGVLPRQSEHTIINPFSLHSVPRHCLLCILHTAQKSAHSIHTVHTAHILRTVKKLHKTTKTLRTKQKTAQFTNGPDYTDKCTHHILNCWQWFPYLSNLCRLFNFCRWISFQSSRMSNVSSQSDLWPVINRALQIQLTNMLVSEAPCLRLGASCQLTLLGTVDHNGW